MAESTAIDCLYRFCRAVIAVFGELYLRSPTTQDTEQILATNATREFSGMLGSIDCKVDELSNGLAGYLQGSNNDINVLLCSLVFAKLVEGHAPPVNYEVSGHHYNKGYYLADGIYPTWSTFRKTMSSPKLPKEAWFAKEQEAARKDVERAFGILQTRFAVVWFPAMTWSQDQM
ncbi:uncharacterized protein [Lolium perenne]|uniref:uncharacterized protein n=1 Tax=Lolium perenne TaxID=4522 RepID=UPI003A99CF91